MHSPITALGLLALAVVACGDPSPTSPSSPASLRGAALERSGASRPFKGSCALTVTVSPLSVPPVLHQVDTGTCTLTHLGLTEFYGEQDINVVAGTQSGWRTLTAANGDELRITHVGTSAPAGPGLVSFVAQLTIVGGTGRFAGATGSAQAVGLANLATRSTSVTFDGTISY
ncbi:MAG: hypothetical protein K0S86_2039 [Geminicoccaceae bacterium]|jgi:hypothetical protein|nr:hypothetical protein [Geminicoccaceae bacterium]